MPGMPYTTHGGYCRFDGYGWEIEPTRGRPGRVDKSRVEGGFLITEHYIGGQLVSMSRRPIKPTPEPQRAQPAAAMTAASGNFGE